MPKPIPEPAKRWQVRVWYDDRDAGQTFGAFDQYQDAERCVLVLAGRGDVRKAQIEESE